jgi:alkylation response protein AidB-like acyl-CoA dehydrogenase
VDLLLNADEDQIQRAVSAMLADTYPGDNGSPRILSPELWSAAVDLGWLGIGLDEAAGGYGGGPIEDVLVFRELGRHCAPLEIAVAAIAAHAAARLRPDLARVIIDGTRRVGLAIRIRGSADALLLGPHAPDFVIHVAQDGLELREATAILNLQNTSCLDPSLGASRGRLADPPLVIETGQAHHRALLILAAIESGLAERARDLACEHAKTRVQFGKPIGSFQAVRHVCADMALRCEAANAQAHYAAAALAGGIADSRGEVSAAVCLSGTAAMENVRDAIQIFGAIGVTDEHLLHLLLKRAHVLDEILGGRASRLDRMLSA